MPDEPKIKRAITFIDGQNLYHCARTAFASCTHPNYDVLKISRTICERNGWILRRAHFYTGYPARDDNLFWHDFWQRKLLAIVRQGVQKYSRPLHYRNKTIRLDDGTEICHRVGEEKGIDVRIAIDVIRFALDHSYDVAVIFSQDQDFSEVANEVKKISREQGRWIKLASAYPVGPGTNNARGINGTDWIKIDQTTYEQCTDPGDYRPPTSF